jgi:hypothetical protein
MDCSYFDISIILKYRKLHFHEAPVIGMYYLPFPLCLPSYTHSIIQIKWSKLIFWI